jgi:hypothetical protein
MAAMKESFPKTEWHGTLRYRHELIDTETASSFQRQRLLAKIDLQSHLHDDLTLGFGLTTGAPDPISSNQTLDAGFSTKGIGIGNAYFKYNPSGWKLLTVQGGKYKNPFVTPGGTELIWDGDLNPEGLGFNIDKDLGGIKVFFKNGFFWVEENNAGDDIMMTGDQLGVVLGLSDDLHLTVGSSYYDYYNVDGAATVFNTTSAYNELEGFLALNGKAAGIPWEVNGDLVYNLGADDDNVGWLAGFSLGKAKEAHSTQFYYNYRSLESDAVLGAFADSDFGGGGTNAEGHELGFAYAVCSYFVPAATYFFNQQGVTAGTDFHRLQLDLKFTF